MLKITLNAIFIVKKVDLDESNWPDKLQVTLLLTYIIERNVLAHFQSLFGRSNSDALWKK